MQLEMSKRTRPVKKKVLIIEDDLDVSDILTVLLEGLETQVFTAADGQAGVAATLKEKPDLILVDLHLPGMNGLDVIRTLRATPGLGSLPIIVITGNSTVEYIRETARLGATDFLVKANVLAGAGLQRIKKHLRSDVRSPRKINPSQ
jgi:two-component system response regulator MtrA